MPFESQLRLVDNYGEIARNLRLERGLTLPGLANKGCLEKGQIHHIENQHWHPGTWAISALAFMLEIHPGVFIEGWPEAAAIPQLETSLAQLIHHHRNSHNLTQVKLGTQCLVTPETICRYEKNHRAINPPLEILSKFSYGMQQPIEVIVGAWHQSLRMEKSPYYAKNIGLL